MRWPWRRSEGREIVKPDVFWMVQTKGGTHCAVEMRVFDFEPTGRAIGAVEADGVRSLLVQLGAQRLPPWHDLHRENSEVWK